MEYTWSCLQSQIYKIEDYSISPIRPTHIHHVRLWRNNQMDVLRQNKPISCSEQESYFSEFIWPTMSLTAPPNILMGFHVNDKLIGYGGLVHISWIDQRAEMSFLVDNLRSKDSKHYKRDFSAFISLIRKLAFEDLGLHKLFTETYATRHEHIHILESAGFQREGLLRDHVKIGNNFVDSIFHAVFSS